MYRDAGTPLDDEASFLEEGLIDSTGIVQLVTFLEQRFAIRIADDEVVPDNLDSLARIARFVCAKQEGRQLLEVRK
jgi:acyl carrier protein